MKRDPALVLEDVVDDYVSVERAAKDYGVVIRTVDAELCDYEIDEAGTQALRAEMAASRVEWPGRTRKPSPDGSGPARST